MTEETIEDWKAIFNLSRSPFHPTLKAIVCCIFHSRDWDSGQSCISQTTIAESCGFDARSVRRWIQIAKELGFFSIDILGGNDFRKMYPKLAKFTHHNQRYTVYSFDFNRPIWVQMWGYEELYRKFPQAIQPKRQMPTGKRFKKRVNTDTVPVVNTDTVPVINHGDDSVETTKSSCKRVEQVTPLTRRTDNAPPSWSTHREGRFKESDLQWKEFGSDFFTDVFGDTNHD